MKNLLLLLLVSSNVYSRWPNNFKDRSKLKDDSLFELNNIVNKTIQDVVTEFNYENGSDCRKEISKRDKDEVKTKFPIMKKLQKKFFDGTVLIYNSIESKIVDNESIQKSYYKDATSDDDELYGKSVFALRSFSPSIRVNGTVIGIDKISNFFGSESTLAFENIFHYGRGVKSIFGGISARAKEDSTGIVSHADIISKASGARFWSNFLSLTSSPENTYLKCRKDGKYEINRAFDFANYIDDSWDEALNCNTLNDSGSPSDEWKTYQKYLKENKGCPVKKEFCQKHINKNCANEFISPLCFEKYKHLVNEKRCYIDDFLHVDKLNKSGYRYNRLGDGQNSQKSSGPSSNSQ